MTFPNPKTIATQIKALSLLDTGSTITTGYDTSWTGGKIASASLPAMVVIPGAGRYIRHDASHYLVERPFLMTLYVTAVASGAELTKIQATARNNVLPYLTSIPAYWAKPAQARLGNFAGVLSAELESDTGVDLPTIDNQMYSACQWIMMVLYRPR